MTAYLEALAAIAVALSVLMAGAWVVQQRTGNSGWVDTVWTFALGVVGRRQRAVAASEAALRCAGNGWSRALVAIWSLRLGMHIAGRPPGCADDPRYAGFAKEWGGSARDRCSSFCRTRG